jgi:hypothetical protein
MAHFVEEEVLLEVVVKVGLKVLLKLRTTFLECLCSTRYMGVAFSQYSRKHPQSELFEPIHS